MDFYHKKILFIFDLINYSNKSLDMPLFSILIEIKIVSVIPKEKQE